MKKLLIVLVLLMGVLTRLAGVEGVDLRVSLKVVGKPVEKEAQWKEFIDRIYTYLEERGPEGLYPTIVDEGPVKAIEVEDGFVKDSRFSGVKDGEYTLIVSAPAHPGGTANNFRRRVVVKDGRSDVSKISVTLPLNMLEFQFQVGGGLTFQEGDELSFVVEIYQTDPKDAGERVVDLKVEPGRKFFEDRTMGKIILFMISDGVYSARVTSTRVKSGNVERVSKVVSCEIKDGRVVGDVVKFDEVAD